MTAWELTSLPRANGFAILVGAVLASAVATFPESSRADEAGVGLWLPGTFGSLAAVPGKPGWSVALLSYNSTVDAGARAPLPQGGNLRLGVSGSVNILGFGPTYTFEQPVLGGQASLSVLALVGDSRVSVDATLSGPGGGQVSGEESDSLFSYGDLLPQATLKWGNGVHNTMVYVMGGIPIGDYEPNRLVNLGLGHGAIDAGVGYTYFDPESGWEASIVTGVTYNFENTDTRYQNGIDGHVDWGISYFPSETWHFGAVGYAYQQITGDSGEGTTLGDFKSRVYGLGPQVGHFFKMGNTDGYVNLKGYYEFGAKNRPEGWNVWLSVGFSLPKG